MLSHSTRYQEHRCQLVKVCQTQCYIIVTKGGGEGVVKVEVSTKDYLIISDLETGKAESGRAERK